MSRSILILALSLASFLFASAPALAAPPPYYPPLEWIPAAWTNYDVGRTAQITTIVIHETEGPYLSVVNWFTRPYSYASAHYVVRAFDGGIVQFVAESDTAYHARSANPWTIGIEHEFDLRYGIGHTDAQYRSSAALTCAIARRYGIPTDRAHIVGHNELPGNDHRDPGPTWNWSYYMSLVRACSARAQGIARASSVGPSELPLYPASGLSFGDQGPDVALLQWSLAYLDFLAPDDLAGGSGNFGPATQDALRQFQAANGVPATGLYGDLSSAALARAFKGGLAGFPVTEVGVGAESDGVAAIQTALETLGYMDLVTGYFGPITADALKRFQQDNGIDATATYDAVTRTALAARLRHPHVEPAAAAAAAEPTPDAHPQDEPVVPGDFASQTASATAQEAPSDLGVGHFLTDQ